MPRYFNAALKADARLSSDSIQLPTGVPGEASPLPTLQHQHLPAMAERGLPLPQPAVPRKKRQALAEGEETVTPAGQKRENVTDARVERRQKGFPSGKHKKGKTHDRYGEDDFVVLHIG